MEKCITVYEHVDFGGTSQNLSIGTYNMDKLMRNDCISSIKVPEGMAVKVFEHHNFEGRMKIFTEDTSWIGDDFNDIASSIIVEPAATIYVDANYNGESQNLIEGSYKMGDLALTNDSISSIKVPEGLMVILFEHEGFSGKAKTLSSDTSWIGDDFNDIISSIIVTKCFENQRDILNNSKQVIVYEDGEYKGKNQMLPIGRYNIHHLSVVSNDKISSLRIPEGMRVTLYEHNNFAGRSMTLTKDTSWIGNEFNDIISSVIVE